MVAKNIQGQNVVDCNTKHDYKTYRVEFLWKYVLDFKYFWMFVCLSKILNARFSLGYISTSYDIF